MFYRQRLKRIEDKGIRSLYKDVIYTYSGLLHCIETISEPNSKFYYNSLRFSRTPPEKMSEHAKFILHFQEEKLPALKYNVYSILRWPKPFLSNTERYTILILKSKQAVR
jgi:hypothetical protein